MISIAVSTCMFCCLHGCVTDCGFCNHPLVDGRIAVNDEDQAEYTLLHLIVSERRRISDECYSKSEKRAISNEHTVS